MWSSALISLYRSLTRHRLYAALNVGGLALGIAVFLVLWTSVAFEFSYDRWVPGAERIHRVDARLEFSPSVPAQKLAMAPEPLIPSLIEEFPQIEAAARLQRTTTDIRRGANVEEEEVARTTPEFFRVFDLPFVEGSAATALATPQSVVLTETVARKYFGETSAIGRELERVQGPPLVVTGVLRDLPTNSSLEVGMISPAFPAPVEGANPAMAWGSFAGEAYVKLREADDFATVQAGMAGFGERRITGAMTSEVLSFSLSPLLERRFGDLEIASVPKPGIERIGVVVTGVVGLLTLLVSAINYVNLSTARAAMRAREVGLRKVVGASRTSLALQFLGEAVVLALIAALIGLALAELALPSVNAMTGADLTLKYSGLDGAVPAALMAALVVGLGAGLYPALVLSSFQPVAALGTAAGGGAGRLGILVREGLVVLQFAVAVALTIAALAMYAQTRHSRTGDSGYDRADLVTVENLRPDTGFQPMLTAFRAVPGVEAVTVSGGAPGDSGFSSAPVFRPGQTGDPIFMSFHTVGQDYFETYGMRLLAGRFLGGENRLDDLSVVGDGPRFNVILNESAVRQIGFDTPARALGQSVVLARPHQTSDNPEPISGSTAPNATIVGVVGDARFGAPTDPVEPAYYQFRSEPGGLNVGNLVATVRLDPALSHQALTGLEAAWKARFPNQPYAARTMEARLEPYYAPDERRGRLLGIGAGLTIAIGALGLYGLAAFTAARRTREIGIRKALGASSADVLRLLTLQFLRPVVVANLIAWPVAWFLLETWLARFDQRIELSPVFFAIGSGLALLIAAGTIAWQAWRAAGHAPARALRSE